MVGRTCHHVEHVVHPVAEIDVGVAARRIHHVRARRPPLVRMAGGVLLAEIRLRLDNPCPQNRTVFQPAAQRHAEQRLCHRHGVRPIVLFRQSHSASPGQTF